MKKLITPLFLFIYLSAGATNWNAVNPLIDYKYFYSIQNKHSSWTSGNGSPESVVTGAIGDIYTRRDGGATTTLYIKESGTGNTGWIAK